MGEDFRGLSSSLTHSSSLGSSPFICFSIFAVGWCEMKGSYACVTFRFNLVLDWPSYSRKGHQTHCKTIFSGYDDLLKDVLQI